MPRAICRCGQSLTVPTSESEGRVVCPGCGSRVRIRAKDPAPVSMPGSDGYIRFVCPCGRRLKVPSALPPSHGKCPDCGTIVPVPTAASPGTVPGHPETETADLSPADLRTLEAWSHAHLDRAASRGPSGTLNLSGPVPPAKPKPPTPAAEPRAEAGLRVCPRCHRPVHLGSETCPECGTLVPRR